MCDICQQHGSDVARNLAHARKVDHARVGRRTGNQHLGLELLGLGPDGLHVEQPVGLTHAIGVKVVEDAAEVL